MRNNQLKMENALHPAPGADRAAVRRSTNTAVSTFWWRFVLTQFGMSVLLMIH